MSAVNLETPHVRQALVGEPPYIPDSRGIRLMREVHQEPSARRVPLALAFIVWALITAGACAMAYGAAEFFVAALSLFGRPA